MRFYLFIITFFSSLGLFAQKSEIDFDAVVLTFNYDTGERYISVEGLF